MLVNILNICSDDELLSDNDDTVEEGKSINFYTLFDTNIIFFFPTIQNVYRKKK